MKFQFKTCEFYNISSFLYNKKTAYDGHICLVINKKTMYHISIISSSVRTGRKSHNVALYFEDYLNENNLNYYFQFTLNDFVKENLEPSVPSVESRIETFIKLSEKIGKEKVIWRFDPLILTDKIGVNELLDKIDRICF